MHARAPVEAQSIVHQSSAAVLFAAGYVHCITMDVLLHKSAAVPSSRASKLLKLALTVGMFGPILVGLVRHPTVNAEGKQTMSLDDMSWGAVGQWLGVLSLLGYFASYHFEFAHPALGRQATEMKRDGGKQETRASNRDATGSNLLRELGLGFFAGRARAHARWQGDVLRCHARMQHAMWCHMSSIMWSYLWCNVRYVAIWCRIARGRRIKALET
eukprot:Tamp_11819.p1 GENE.Tamp_11819~~Tamp_11819.p1  ORF type:complete len:215 (+),score=24.01 Tamp_11819:704-1348(+)